MTSLKGSPKQLSFVAVLVTGLLISAVIEARGFRNFAPIASSNNQFVPQTAYFDVPGELPPITDEAVTQVLNDLFLAWNNGTLESKLSNQFFDASQLADAIQSDVPRDARLSLLTLRSMRTLTQYVEEDPTYGRVRVSQVSAIALTQLQYNELETGEFVNLEGENEFLISIRERLVR